MAKQTFLTFLFSTFLLFNCFSQKTIVRGTIIDKMNNEPIPFVPIVFKNTGIGSTSNELGLYTIETDKKSDSIVVTFIGYKKQTISIIPNKTQRIDVLLEPDNYTLSEVKIKPGRNPAFRIMDKVISHKKQNNNSEFKAYEWEMYDKFQIYFGNYSEKFTKRKQFKNYNFIFNYADSTADGRALLPIYMSETIKKEYASENPYLNESITIAQKLSGENYEQLTIIANKMVENINIYNNFFLILDKSFISPINDNYQLYYKYYLEDSLIIGQQKCYQIRFTPKWKEDFAFSGTMFINDTSFAVKKIDLYINNEINLNYVKDFIVKQEFEYVNKQWVQKKFETAATISPIKRKQSEEFTVHRTTSYKDIIINSPEHIQQDYFKQTNTETIITNEQYWDTARHELLSEKEKYNYLVADTINYVPFIKKLKKAAIALATGYIEIGKVSIGQLHTFYSFNPIEQNRLKLGLKTNKKFSKQLQLEGYAAYGFADKTIKYKGSVLYVLRKDKNRALIGGSYMYDIAQMGVSDNHIEIDNILTSLTRTSTFSKLSLNREAKIYLEKQWNKNISNKISFTNTKITPLGSLVFNKYINTNDTVIQHFKNITTSELEVNTRLSFDEDYLINDFRRISLGTKYPIINLNFIYGFKNFIGSTYDYKKIKLNIKGKLRLNPIGYTQYTIEGGKVFGNVPFALLEIHSANQTLVYDVEAFNLMNYFEFASNEYISLFLDHHFDGFFFNKLPLIKKAKLREVISARGLIGNLDRKNAEFIFPTGLKGVNKPYLECSVGIENIFKVVRIDYIWRVTQFGSKPTDNWSIKAKFYFSF